MTFLDKLEKISLGFGAVSLVTLIAITGFVSWASVNLVGYDLVYWLYASMELLDIVWIFSLGILLGWYLSPRK
ncbi:hypothetical protein [Vibrio owensii]|uniref:hypothetical protein n=1 Tax=Vibrio owensii TaxID=696485 RepID=UPI0005F00A5D|nr:hypothetical protein [Vibrio owensii]